MGYKKRGTTISKKNLADYARRMKLDIDETQTRKEMIHDIVKKTNEAKSSTSSSLPILPKLPSLSKSLMSSKSPTLSKKRKMNWAYFRTWLPRMESKPKQATNRGDNSTWLQEVSQFACYSTFRSMYSGYVQRIPSFFSPTGDPYFQSATTDIYNTYNKFPTGFPTGFHHGQAVVSGTSNKDRELECKVEWDNGHTSTLRLSSFTSFRTASELKLKKWKQIEPFDIIDTCRLPTDVCAIIAEYVHDCPGIMSFHEETFNSFYGITLPPESVTAATDPCPIYVSQIESDFALRGTILVDTILYNGSRYTRSFYFGVYPEKFTEILRVSKRPSNAPLHVRWTGRLNEGEKAIRWISEDKSMDFSTSFSIRRQLGWVPVDSLISNNELVNDFEVVVVGHRHPRLSPT
jgi:hypothetical protein